MATSYVYWVLMPAGSSTGSVTHPVEPKGSEIFKVAAGSAVDKALQNGGTVSIGGKQWQPYMVGSFPTQAAAKAAAPPSGLSYIGTLVGGSVGAVISGFTNPTAAPTDISGGASAGSAAAPGLGQIGQFFSDLTSANTWIRVAKVVAGGMLLIIGLAHMTGVSGAAANAARKVPLPV